MIARQRFAEGGYEATSMRAIAAEAGVDPSVVAHFFGSKDGLFRAAVGWPFDPSAIAARLREAGPEGIGARVASAFLGAWEDPSSGPGLLAMLRSAMSHETSAALLRQFVTEQLFTQVSGLVRLPDAELRVNLAAAHLVGVAVLRYALRIEPIASMTAGELVVRLTPALTHYLEEDGQRRRR
jgi:AcrR family transcriptional regulator